MANDEITNAHAIDRLVLAGASKCGQQGAESQGQRT